MVIFHTCVSHYQAGYSPIDGHFIGNFCPSIPSIPSIPATSRGYVTGVARSVPEVFVACGEHGEEGDAAASGIFLGSSPGNAGISPEKKWRRVPRWSFCTTLQHWNVPDVRRLNLGKVEPAMKIADLGMKNHDVCWFMFI